MVQEITYEWTSGLQCADRIYDFLRDIDEIMIPPLQGRVDIREYAEKLAEKADTVFARRKGRDIASCSIYCNTQEAFISSIAVKKPFLKQHVGSNMMAKVITHAKEQKCRSICLEVYESNTSAVKFYQKNGFEKKKCTHEWITMECKLH